jgi:hypothetical protein
MADTVAPNEATPPPAQTAGGRYAQLEVLRQPYDQRAREAATLTIPGLIPPLGSTSSTRLPTPWQSIGARGVNNLAAKLLLALFPPGSAFFKLSVAEATMDALKKQDGGSGQGGNVDVEAEMEQALSKVERAVVKWMEATNLRPLMFETAKHLVVAGNALIQIQADSFKLYTLTQYVVKRDLSGNVLEIITKEMLARRTLPSAARAIVEKHSGDKEYSDPTASLELFTQITRKDNGSWRVHQEICGETIPGTEGFYPKDRSAWIPLRWTSVAGEDYGRAHCEEYIGDLLSSESLAKSLIDGAAACARILFLTNEAGVTSKKKLAEAPNLSIVDGDVKDVGVLRVDKMSDFAFAGSQADKIERRLEQAFLLTSSIQRNAERVTAEEIRTMAGELEQALGGVYSTFSQEWQRPLVDRVLFIMQRANKLPHFPEKSVTPEIVTGIEGLGRMSDYQRLRALLTDLGQTFGPEALAEYTNVGSYIKRSGAALAIDIDGLVRSEEEVQAARQAKMQAAMAQQLGPASIQANAKRDVAATQAAAQAAPPAQ